MMFLLTVPFQAYSAMTINCDLAATILQERDTRIYHFWCIVYCACLVAEVQQKGVLYSSYGIFISLILALMPLIDAFPPTLRVIFNKFGSPLALGAMLIVQVSFYFNWCGCQLITISFFGEMKTTTRSLASSALNNMIILLASNIITAYRHPSSLVMIHSRVETLQLTEREATLLRAMDRNASDLSKRSNDVRQKEVAALIARARSSMVEMFSFSKKAQKEETVQLSVL
jgi:hypothetical protein